MRMRELAVAGAYEFTPKIFADHRGLFVSPHQGQAFTEAVGKPLFPVAQTNISMSRRGVVRGIHFSATPPGTAKYVYCAGGKVLDFVIDIRAGSPTYGKWDSVLLDTETFRASYLPMGVGHAFVALEDRTMMCYLISESYDPAIELSLSVLDKDISLVFPDGIEPILSERDLAAPTLSAAAAAGILPDYLKCTS